MSNDWLNRRMAQRLGNGPLAEYMIGGDRGVGSDGLGYVPRNRADMLEAQEMRNYQGPTPGELLGDFRPRYAPPSSRSTPGYDPAQGGPAPEYGTKDWQAYYNYNMQNPTDANMQNLYGPEELVQSDIFGRPIPLQSPRYRPQSNNYGGGGPYDEEKSMPMPGGGGRDFGPMPPAAYRGGRNKMIADYLMDAGAQGGANGFLNDRLMNRVSPAQGNPMSGSVKLQEFIAQYGREPETDMEMMMVFGGDGSPSPSPRAGIARELMRK